MKYTILCINSGSSSIKFALYRIQETEELIAEGAVERIGLSGGWLWLKDGLGKPLDKTVIPRKGTIDGQDGLT